MWCVYRQRLYANVGECVIPPEEEENPYTYGDDTIYDSICYYQAPVCHLDLYDLYNLPDFEVHELVYLYLYCRKSYNVFTVFLTARFVIQYCCSVLFNPALYSVHLQPVKTSDADEKKSYVMKELYETERSFLTVLHLISQDFFNALCELICAEDVQLIFSTAKVRQNNSKYFSYNYSEV